MSAYVGPRGIKVIGELLRAGETVCCVKMNPGAEIVGLGVYFKEIVSGSKKQQVEDTSSVYKGK